MEIFRTSNKLIPFRSFRSNHSLQLSLFWSSVTAGKAIERGTIQKDWTQIKNQVCHINVFTQQPVNFLFASPP